MKKSDCITVCICIVFLIFTLGAIGESGRQQARTLACAANCKQVGQIVSLYQSDYDGYVPVIFNQYVIQGATIPAKCYLVSVALAHYSPETANPSPQNPFIELLAPNPPWTDQRWYPTGAQRYYTYLLPKQYCCPFVRGYKNFTATPEIVVVGGGHGPFNDWSVQLYTITTAGYRDTFSTWIRAAGHGAGRIWWPGNLLGRGYGVEKYGVLPWNRSQETQDPWYGNFDWNWAMNNPIRWGKKNLQAVNAASMAEATILYCSQGQWDAYAYLGPPYGIYNYGSHKCGETGGTNAVFGDLHVDWVNGFQIGWP